LGFGGYEFLAQGITTAATMGLIALVTYTTTTGAQRTTVEVMANRNTIRLNKLHAYFGWGCMLISLPFAVVPFTEEGDWLLFVMSPLMIVGFGGSGYYFLSYYYRHRVSWDQDAFTLTTRNGVTTTLRWADVMAASHQPSSGFLLLYTTMGYTKSVPI
jgi:hypothetical protein